MKIWVAMSWLERTIGDSTSFLKSFGRPFQTPFAVCFEFTFTSVTNSKQMPRTFLLIGQGTGVVLKLRSTFLMKHDAEIWR